MRLFLSTLGGLMLLALVTGSASAQDPATEARVAMQTQEFVRADSLFDLALQSNPNDRDLLTDAGIVAVELEKYDKAALWLGRAYEGDRKNVRLSRAYGVALSNLGQCQRSVEILQNTLALDKGELDTYIALGNAYIQCGSDSLSRAELMLLTANKKYPKNARLAVAIGDLYFEQKIYELAEGKYDEALEINPELIDPRIRRARIYRQYARMSPTLDSANVWYNKALFEFNNVTGRSPRTPRPWMEQGEILMLAQQWENATQSFLYYQKLRPDDVRADTLLAAAAIGGNYYQQAIEPLNRILNKNDSASLRVAPRARILLGKAYYATKNFDSAVLAYSRLQESELDNEALELYARALMEGPRDTSRALGIFRALANRNPNDCVLSMALAKRLFVAKRFDEMIDVLSQRLRTCPAQDPGGMYYLIGLGHYQSKRYDRAAEAFQQAIRADDTVEINYYWLMNSYAVGKKYGKAGEVGNMMVAKGIDKRQREWASNAYYYGGIGLFQAKKYKEAITQLNRALQYDASYSDAILFIAYSYQSLGDIDNACKNYKRVKSLGGENAKSADENMKKIGCK